MHNNVDCVPQSASETQQRLVFGISTKLDSSTRVFVSLATLFVPGNDKSSPKVKQAEESHQQTIRVYQLNLFSVFCCVYVGYSQNVVMISLWRFSGSWRFPGTFFCFEGSVGNDGCGRFCFCFFEGDIYISQSGVRIFGYFYVIYHYMYAVWHTTSHYVASKLTSNWKVGVGSWTCHVATILMSWCMLCTQGPMTMAQHDGNFSS